MAGKVWWNVDQTAQALRVGNCDGNARTVLLVEDDADVREALGEVIETLGCQVVGASNGADALSYLRASPPPCLILLDLMMPVMNGFEFRAAQVADAPLAEIPVVLLSADANLPRDASALGVREYMPKPIDLDQLLHVVERHFPQPS